MAAPLFPVHQRGVAGTLTDTMHIVLTIVTVLFILLMIGFGAAADGRPFRLYSMGTLVTVLLFSALASVDAPSLAANQPTLWIGVI